MGRRNAWIICGFVLLGMMMTGSAQGLASWRIPDGIGQMLASEGKIYLKVWDQRHPGAVYQYDPDQGTGPELYYEGLRNDADTLFVIEGSLYVQQRGRRTLKLVKAAPGKTPTPAIALFPKAGIKGAKRLSVQHSVTGEGTLTVQVWRDSGSGTTLCHLDLISGKLSLYNGEPSEVWFECFDFETVSATESLLIRRLPIDPVMKEPEYLTNVILYNWETGKSKTIGKLPLNTANFAYDRETQLLYYIDVKERALYHMDMGGNSRLLREGLPDELYTQSASFLGNGALAFVTIQKPAPGESGTGDHYHTLHVLRLGAAE